MHKDDNNLDNISVEAKKLAAPLPSPKEKPDKKTFEYTDDEVLAKASTVESKVPKFEETLKEDIGTYHKLDYVSNNVEEASVNKILRWFVSSPAKLIISSFVILILIGTLLLALPISNNSARWTDPFTSIFTSTSAVTVSGITLVDTGLYWSGFGQAVILVLMQIGGIGLITIAAMFFILADKKINMNTLRAVQDSIGGESVRDVSDLVKSVVKVTLGLEFIGAIILTWSFWDYMAPGEAIWTGVFQSVAAFNNSGFDILSPHFPSNSSLTFFSGNVLVLITVGLLITFGGIGFIVWKDILDAIKNKRALSFHSILVLSLTAIVISVSSFLILFFEWNNTSANSMGLMDSIDKSTNALFQTMTMRTAGFSSVDQSTLTYPTKLLGSLIMFAGASPVSTGGGLKITTLAIFLSAIGSSLRGRKEVNLLGHKISSEVVRRATVIVAVYLISLVSLIAALVITQDGALQSGVLTVEDIFYESISALSTTGISSESTALMNRAGHVILMLAMLVGRVGPFTITLTFSYNKSKDKLATEVLPEGDVYLG